MSALTIQAVSDALQAASSQVDAQQRQLGEAQLKSWETTPRFHEFLQTIYLDSRSNLATRWIAIIYLKNGLIRYWRRTATK